jgi:hypothetical protein
LRDEILAGRPEKEQTPAMQRGQDQEDAICNAAAALKNWTLEIADTTYHAEVPYLLCHPDRLILRCRDEDIAPGVLEAKCPASAFLAQKQYDRYVSQLQWEILCTGYAWGALAVGYGDWLERGAAELRVIPMMRNDALCRTFLELSQIFWQYLGRENANAKRTDW